MRDDESQWEPYGTLMLMKPSGGFDAVVARDQSTVAPVARISGAQRAISLFM